MFGRIPKNVLISVTYVQRSSLAATISLSMILAVSITYFRHRKTHERSGATQSPSSRNTPIDSARNTPFSGDEESDPSQHEQLYHNFVEGEADPESHSNIAEFTAPQPYHPGHFRSFSHDGHLNQYTMPTSHGLNTLNGIHPATPPNEVEENNSHKDGPSPVDTDESHSYHGDVQSSYIHQTYHTLTDPAAAADITKMGMMLNDPLRKDYSMMDTSLMNQTWTYQ